MIRAVGMICGTKLFEAPKTNRAPNKMNARPIRRFSGLLTLCCLLVGGCDRTPDPEVPVAAPTHKAKSSASASSVDPMAGMVKAVTSDTRHQAIDLRFELTSRPQVGEAVEIKLALRAIDDAADVKLTISSDPKLVIVTGGEAALGSIKAGELVSHTVTLRPTGTGIFVLDANLAATSNGGPHTLSYSMPVAVVAAVQATSSSAAAATVTHK